MNQTLVYACCSFIPVNRTIHIVKEQQEELLDPLLLLHDHVVFSVATINMLIDNNNTSILSSWTTAAAGSVN